ncbi:MULTISPECIES: hypothetical protein [unclassified Bradyrhizobium]|uniref:hypothetical protein n=1 Tax=unclassified Bradyrhizobium TaxID=2631580 RepID=UPI002915E32F|nr:MULTISPECIES: hypothetical protein [unclassified Bradyrhizobium]
MVWGLKKSSAPSPIVEPKKPEQSPDEIISEMLNAYQQHFYEQQKARLDPSAEEAKNLIKRAERLIQDSRIGYSICELVDHTKRWPSWSRRDDFQKYVGFPALDISATVSKTDGRDPHDKVTVHFIYSGRQYATTFVDEGIPSWDEDYNRYGRVEFFAGSDRMLGVEIIADTKRGFEYERWTFWTVFAFAPGQWMKDLVEIAAHIDAHRTSSRNQLFDDIAIEKAKNIRL